MKSLEYVSNLLKFTFRNNRLLYLSITISIASAAIELLAMSSLLPLFSIISGTKPDYTNTLVVAIGYFGQDTTAGTMLWCFIVLFAVRIATQLLGQSLSMYLGRQVMAQLTSTAFRKIIHQISIHEIHDKSIGYYINIAGDEANRASSLMIALTQFLSTAALTAFYFLAIAKYSPITAVGIAVFMILSLLILLQISKISQRLGAVQVSQSRLHNTLFLDCMNSMKTIRAFSAEDYVCNIHKSLIFGYAKIMFKLDEIVILTKTVPILMLLIIFGCWLFGNTQSVEVNSLAFIVTMIVYLMRFFPTIGQGVSLMMKIASDAQSGKDVTALINVEMPTLSYSAFELTKIKKIEFQSVHFSYDKKSGKEILGGVDLKFEQAKSYAITGKSGVGKSTLVDLLLKFYLPTSGQFWVNDERISEIADSEIRKRIILVGQESAIFDDTVNNNIRLGVEFTQLEVQRACECAHINEVIEGMPDGYNTRLQYQGKNLSGGQRQRIAIARALLRKPDVLIFDESTSALDKVTQEQVIENILRDYKQKIVIFITHDPYIMRRVDKVIDLGRINHQSSHGTFIT